MHRRKILATAAAALALLLATPVVAQRAAEIPRIALVALNESTANMREGGNPRWAALLRELGRIGYVEGKIIIINRWSGEGRADDLYAAFARQVVDSGPDLIVSRGKSATHALQQQTKTIPIINMGTFLQEWNFVESFARPGGNITGFSATLGGLLHYKQVQLLHDAVPTASEIAWLGPLLAWEGPGGDDVRVGARQLGLTLVPHIVDSPINEASVRRAFSAIARREFDALFVASATDMYRYRKTIVELAAEAKLPAMAQQRQYPEAGLLMSYATRFAEAYGQAADYVDRILKGQDPAELPVQMPATFDYLINLRTAKALGITLPLKIMLGATEVIE